MLPGVFIPDAVRITNDIAEAVEGAEMVLFVVPTTAVRSTARLVAPHFDARSLVVNAAKGIERGTGARISTILTEELAGDLEGRTVTFSGPSHAEEVSRKVISLPIFPGLKKHEMETVAATVLEFLENNEAFGADRR